MFILVKNLTTDSSSFIEIRAQSTAHRMRALVLREIDRLYGDWRRTHSCHFFVCQKNNPHRSLTSVGVISNETWEKKRHASAFIQVYMNEKSPGMLAADERRLSIAMAFHSRLGQQSALGWIDELTLHCILFCSGAALRS
jgi:hypothetical protein